MDLYKILGVARNSDELEIKQAYKVLARKYHPDANLGNKEAEEKFKDIAKAYDVLSNPEKRKAYDNSNSGQPTGKRKQKKASGAGSFGMGATPDIGDFIKNMDSYFGFSDITGEGKKEKKEHQEAGKVNPIDVTNIFESFMKLKK